MIKNVIWVGTITITSNKSIIRMLQVLRIDCTEHFLLQEIETITINSYKVLLQKSFVV